MQQFGNFLGAAAVAHIDDGASGHLSLIHILRLASRVSRGFRCSVRFAGWSCHALFCMYRFHAVSYTHLDVYKRQVSYGPARGTPFSQVSRRIQSDGDCERH